MHVVWVVVVVVGPGLQRSIFSLLRLLMGRVSIAVPGGKMSRELSWLVEIEVRDGRRWDGGSSTEVDSSSAD